MTNTVQRKKQKESNQTRVEVVIFKYLIYLFLIVASYKVAIAITVSFGILPELKEPMTGFLIILLSPLYFVTLMPLFLGIVIISILLTYLFFNKSFLFQKFVNFTGNYNSLINFIFWIFIALLPYQSLALLDNIIEINRIIGYENRKVKVTYMQDKQELAYRKKF